MYQVLAEQWKLPSVDSSATSALWTSALVELVPVDEGIRSNDGSVWVSEKNKEGVDDRVHGDREAEVVGGGHIQEGNDENNEREFRQM